MFSALFAIAVGAIEIASGAFGIYDHVKPVWDEFFAQATPLPYATEAYGETLILVAPFDRAEGVPDSLPHEKIAKAIRDTVASLNITDVRVEVLTAATPVSTAEQAVDLGKQARATSVIWGKESSVDINVNILNRRKLMAGMRIRSGENGLEMMSALDYVNPDQFDNPEYADFDSPIPGIGYKPGDPILFSPLLVVSETVPLVTTDNTYVTTNDSPKDYIRLITVDLPRDVTFFALVTVAQVQLFKGNDEVASELLDKALDSRAPGDNNDDVGQVYREAARLHLVRSYQYEVSQSADSTVKKQAEGAIARTQLNQAISYGLTDPLTYYLLGMASAQAGLYQESVNYLDKAVALGADEDLMGYIVYARAFSKRDAGDIPGALADLEAELKLMPDAAGVYVARSAILLDQKDYSGAIADVDRFFDARGQDFYNPHLLDIKGRALMALQEYDAAVENYQRLVDLLAPENRVQMDSFVADERVIAQQALSAAQAAAAK